jgi:hypothetical protein
MMFSEGFKNIRIHIRLTKHSVVFLYICNSLQQWVYRLIEFQVSKRFIAKVNCST